MATGIVQFRESLEEIEFLRRSGINPNDLAREAFRVRLDEIHRAARRKRFEEIRRRFIETNRQHPMPVPIVEWIRRDRESH